MLCLTSLWGLRAQAGTSAPELCSTSWKTHREAPHGTHRNLWIPVLQQRCLSGTTNTALRTQECSTVPEDGCGFESEAAFQTEHDTARTASLKPQRSFTVLQSTNKIQSVIKSVKLQSFQQSLSNNGSQAIPLFKKSDFMAYPNLKYWRDHCSSFPSLKPLLLFSYFFYELLKVPCFGLWFSNYDFIGLMWFAHLNSKCMRSWNISRSRCP